MLRCRFTGMILASALLPSPAAAQSIDEDIRCMVLSNVFAKGAKDAVPREAAANSLLYYLGRVAARVPATELKSRYLAQVGALQGQALDLLMNSCFKQFRAQERAITSMSQEAAAPTDL